MYDPEAILRQDETWHRLREWTSGQTPSERLAAQLLVASDYKDVDPSHPLGGPDGGRDGECSYQGKPALYAVYFPRGEQTFATIKDKFESDLESALKHSVQRLAFVTNQELKLSERQKLRELNNRVEIDLFHLERIAVLLDQPEMHSIREQYLSILSGPVPLLVETTVEGSVNQFTDDYEVLENFVQIHEKEIRSKSEAAHERIAAEEANHRNNSMGWAFKGISTVPEWASVPIPGLGDEKSPKDEPLSDEEITASVAKYRSELETRWNSCQDYLASVTVPPIRIKISNAQESFLKDVQIVMTFRGVRAVEKDDLERFHYLKVQDPDWRPRRGYWEELTGQYIDASYLGVARDNKEFVWSYNDDGDLEIVITLPSLRPHPAWRSDEDHPQIILMASHIADENPITFSYTVTAEGYGNFYKSDPIKLPVVQEPMRDALRRAILATSEEQEE